MKCSVSDLLSELAGIVGPDWVKTEPQDLANYGKDWTKVYPPQPVAVVLPNTIEAVVAIVKLANQFQIAIVPSGGRTGLSGGAVASNGELVVAMDRMNRIRDFDASDRQVVCEAGVVTEQFSSLPRNRVCSIRWISRLPVRARLAAMSRRMPVVSRLFATA